MYYCVVISYAFCASIFGFVEVEASVISNANTKSRIIGGEPAFAGQFPFAAAIQVQTTNSKFFCGGSLANNDWIITSGHCVYNAVLFTIHLGSIYLDSNETAGSHIISTSTYILHPEFKPETIENDIGLIKFRRPIDFNVYLTPIPVWPYDLADNSQVYAIGWGQTSDSNSSLSNNLQYVLVSTMSNLECRTFYGNQITDDMVCIVGAYNEGTCTGDNGTPLIYRASKYLVLVGISSFISGNGCESINPSGYTRIFPYFEWINNTTRVDPY